MSKKATNPKPKPMLAYSVTENNECTGGIVFAKSAIAARRLGAERYADGEFEDVSCRRAAYCDQFASDGIVPASHLIAQGWHFECSHCYKIIDNDHLWERDILTEDVIGTQDSSVYCNELCKAREALEEAERKHIERRWIRRLTKVVQARFPEAEIITDGPWRRPHAYIDRKNGKYVVKDVTIPFTLPCLKHGPATLVVERYGPERLRLPNADTQPAEKRRRNIFYSCSMGDLEALEVYLKANPVTRS